MENNIPSSVPDKSSIDGNDPLKKESTKTTPVDFSKQDSVSKVPNDTNFKIPWNPEWSKTRDEYLKPLLKDSYMYGQMSAVPFDKYAAGMTAFTDNQQEFRAQNQGAIDKWSFGLAKMVGVAATTFAETFSAFTVGIPTAIEKRSWSGIYDNQASRNLDAFNEKAKEILPHLYTEEANDASLLGQIAPWNEGSGNFWSDKVLNGLGFSLGAILAGVATGGGGMGMRGMNLGARAFRLVDEVASVGGKLYKPLSKVAALGQGEKALATIMELQKAGKLTEVLPELNKLAKLVKYENRANQVFSSGMAALSESAIEGRNTHDNYSEMLQSQYGLSKEEADKQADSVGNTTMALNYALLFGSNYLQFGKLFGGSKYNINKKAINNITSDIYKGVSEVPISKAEKILRSVGRGSKGMFTEGNEEMLQQAFSSGTEDYFHKQYDKKGTDTVNDILESVVYGLGQGYGTRMGLEQGLIGAIIGKGTSMSFNRQNYNKNTKAAVEYVNNYMTTDAVKSMYESLTRHASLSQEQDKHLADGDQFEFHNKKEEVFKNASKSRIDIGRFDLFLSDLEDMKGLNDEEFAKVVNETDGLKVNKEEFVNSLIEKAKDHYKIADAIETLYTKMDKQDRNVLFHYSTAVYDFNRRAVKMDNELSSTLGISFYDKIRGQKDIPQAFMDYTTDNLKTKGYEIVKKGKNNYEVTHNGNKFENPYNEEQIYTLFVNENIRNKARPEQVEDALLKVRDVIFAARKEKQYNDAYAKYSTEEKHREEVKKDIEKSRENAEAPAKKATEDISKEVTRQEGSNSNKLLRLNKALNGSAMTDLGLDKLLGSIRSGNAVSKPVITSALARLKEARALLSDAEFNAWMKDSANMSQEDAKTLGMISSPVKLKLMQDILTDAYNDVLTAHDVVEVKSVVDTNVLDGATVTEEEVKKIVVEEEKAMNGRDIQKGGFKPFSVRYSDVSKEDGTVLVESLYGIDMDLIRSYEFASSQPILDAVLEKDVNDTTKDIVVLYTKDNKKVGLLQDDSNSGLLTRTISQLKNGQKVELKLSSATVGHFVLARDVDGTVGMGFLSTRIMEGDKLPSDVYLGAWDKNNNNKQALLLKDKKFDNKANELRTSHKFAQQIPNGAVVLWVPTYAFENGKRIYYPVTCISTLIGKEDADAIALLLKAKDTDLDKSFFGNKKLVDNGIRTKQNILDNYVHGLKVGDLTGTVEEISTLLQTKRYAMPITKDRVTVYLNKDGKLESAMKDTVSFMKDKVMTPIQPIKFSNSKSGNRYTVQPTYVLEPVVVSKPNPVTVTTPTVNMAKTNLGNVKIKQTIKNKIVRDVIKSLPIGTVIRIKDSSSQRSGSDDYFKTTTDYFIVENGGVRSIGHNVESKFYSLSDIKSFAFKRDIDILDTDNNIIKDYEQTHTFDCGASALRSVLYSFGINNSEDQLVKETGSNAEIGTEIKKIVSVANQKGLVAKSYSNQSFESLRTLSLSNRIILLINGVGKSVQGRDYSGTKDGHYITIKSVENNRIVFEDPATTGTESMTKDELMERWHGLDDSNTEQEGILIAISKPNVINTVVPATIGVETETKKPISSKPGGNAISFGLDSTTSEQETAWLSSLIVEPTETHNPIHVQELDAIMKSDDPFDSLLNTLYRRSKDTELRSLLGKIKNALEGKEVTIEYADGLGNAISRAKTSGKKVTILVNKKLYGSYDNMSHIFTHELLHGVTTQALENPTTKEEVAFRDEVKKLYDFVKGTGKFDSEYAITNKNEFPEKEFLAEIFSNPAFKNKMKGLKVPRTPKNIFEKIVDAIRKFLGLDNGKSVYTLMDRYTNSFLDRNNFKKNLDGTVVEDDLQNPHMVEGLSSHEVDDITDVMTSMVLKQLQSETKITKESAFKGFLNFLDEKRARINAMANQSLSDVNLSDSVRAKIQANIDYFNRLHNTITENGGNNATFLKLKGIVDAKMIRIVGFVNEESVEDEDTDMDKGMTVGKESYGKESWEVNIKDTASSRLKYFLAFVPAMEFSIGEDGKIARKEDGTYRTTIKNTVLFTQKLHPLQATYSTLTSAMTNKKDAIDMYVSLEKLANTNPTIGYIVGELEKLMDSDKANDQALYHEFFSNFYNQQNRFVSLKHRLWGRNNNKQLSTNVKIENTAGSPNSVIKKWYDNYKDRATISDGATVVPNANLIREVSKNIGIITTTAKVDGKTQSEEDIFYNVAKELNRIGIVLSPGTIEYVLSGEMSKPNEKDVVYTSSQLISDIQSVMKDMEKNLQIESSKDDNEDVSEDYVVDKGYGLFSPFINSYAVLNNIATAEYMNNGAEYTSNFLDDKFRRIYTINRSSHLSRTMVKLKGKDATLLNAVKDDVYHKNNNWIQKILEGDSTFMKYFDLQYLSTVGEKGDKGNGKEWSEMSNKDREIILINMFLNSTKKGKMGNFSYFKTPTFGDRKTAAFISAPRIDVTTVNINTSQEVIDETDNFDTFQFSYEAENALYNIFLSEAERINKVKELLDTPGVEIEQLTRGYHYNMVDGNVVLNGAGLKFLKMDFNGVKDNGIPLNEMDLVNDKQVILEKYILPYVRKQLNYKMDKWVKDGILYNEYNAFLQKEIVKISNFNVDNGYGKVMVNGSFNPMMTTKKLVADFTINNAIALDSIYGMFSNDIAYSGTVANAAKRNSVIDSPITSPVTAFGGSFNLMIFEDVRTKYGSTKVEGELSGAEKFLKGMTKLFKEKFNLTEAQAKVEAKNNLNPVLEDNIVTDAAAVVGDELYEEWLLHLGLLDQNMKNLLYRVRNNEDLNIKELNKLMQGLKPVIVTDVYNDFTKSYERIYVKFAVIPLFRQLVEGNSDLMEMYEQAQANKSMITYESAVKQGARGLRNLYDNNGHITPAGKTNIISLPYDSFGVQVSLPYDVKEAIITDSAQEREVGQANLADPIFANETFNVDGNNLTTEQWLKEYNDLNLSYFQDKNEAQKKRFGIVDGKVTNFKSVSRAVVGEMKKRGWSILSQRGMRITNRYGDERFAISPAFLPEGSKLQPIFNAFTSKGIIRHTTFGEAFMQTAAAGFGKKDIRNIESLTEEEKRGIDWFDAKRTLLPWRLNEEGVVEAEDILLPNIYSRVFKAGQVLSDELMYAYGFRIPFQLDASRMPLRIAGFLPEAMGNIVVTTPEFLKRSGSDNDADKLYVYFFNAEETSEGLQKVQYLSGKSEEDTKRRYSRFVKASKYQKAFEREFGISDFDSIEEMTNAIGEFEYSNTSLINYVAEVYGKDITEVSPEMIFNDLATSNEELSYEEFSNLSIERQNTVKARQNRLLDMRIGLLSNPLMLMRAHTVNSVEDYKQASKGMESPAEKFPLDTYMQHEMYKNAIDGKSGVATASLAVKFNAYAQFGNGTSFAKGKIGIKTITEIDGKWQKTNLGLRIIDEDKKHTDDSNENFSDKDWVGLTDLGKTRDINGKFLIDALVMAQSSCVDNPKNGYNSLVGLNDMTIKQWLYFISLGYSNVEGLKTIFRQPVIDEYAEVLSGLNSPFFEKNFKKQTEVATERTIKYLSDQANTIKDKDVKKLATDTIAQYGYSSVLGRIVKKNTERFPLPFDNDKGKTSINDYRKFDEVSDSEKVEWIRHQLDHLETYQSHEVDANDWFMFTAKINMQSRGVGKDYNDVKRRYDYFLPKGSAEFNSRNNIATHFNKGGSSNLIGLAEMVTSHPVLNYLINDVLADASTKFYSDKLLPNKSVFWVETNRLMKRSMSINSKKNAPKLDKNKTTFLTTLNGNGIFGKDEDLQLTRMELLSGPTSMAKRIQKLQNTMPNQDLLKYLSVDFASESLWYDTVKYDRSNLEDNVTEKMQGGWVDLYNNPETTKDAVDLMKYIYLTTGGAVKSSGLQAIISPEYLIENGFADFYYSNEFKEKSRESIASFEEQYYRNYAKELNNGVNDTLYALKSQREEDGKLYMYVNPKNNGEALTSPYAKYFDQLLKRHVALKAVSLVGGKEMKYEVLSPLGDMVTPEFDANADNIVSIFKENELKEVTLTRQKGNYKGKKQATVKMKPEMDYASFVSYKTDTTVPQNTESTSNEGEYIISMIDDQFVTDDLVVLPEGISQTEWDMLSEEERQTALWQIKHC